MAASDLTQEVTMSNQATDKIKPCAFMVCRSVHLIVSHLVLLLTLNVHASKCSHVCIVFLWDILHLFCCERNLLTTSALVLGCKGILFGNSVLCGDSA